MNTKEFWSLIDTSISKNNLEQSEIIEDIQRQLSSYSIKDIREFEFIFKRKTEKVKLSKVLESTSVLFNKEVFYKEGTSWSKYDFFIGWLIMQGSEFYNFALEDHISFNDLIQNVYNSDINKCLCEEALHIASSAYEFKTGRNYFEDF